MTTNPYSITPEQTLKAASHLMQEHHIRHLPVIHNGDVTGMVTDRDIKFALGLVDVNPDKIKVKDIAKDEVYVVSPESKLDEVVAYMASRKLGSAIVMDNAKLVGIFTAVDAMNALAELLGSGQKAGTCCNH